MRVAIAATRIAASSTHPDAFGPFEERMPLWEQIQANAYTQIPALKIGGGATISSRSDKIGGWSPEFETGYKYWNLWIQESTAFAVLSGSPPRISETGFRIESFGSLREH
jgi:hypothetical protein